jgi:hypothetical protein
MIATRIRMRLLRQLGGSGLELRLGELACMCQVQCLSMQLLSICV